VSTEGVTTDGNAFDAVIVGAGPAGSAAALGLARNGARTIVIERSSVPRYKTCGGGVVARALGFLPAGVGVQPERYCHAAELSFFDGGPRILVERREPIVAMTMRSDFDGALISAARRAGAEFRESCTFQGFVENRRGLDVRTDRGTLRARFLIGADGATGPVARSAGWDRAPFCIPALEAEIRVDGATMERFASAARFDFGLPPDGYGWVFPKRRHLSAGVLRMRRGAGELKRLLRQYLEEIGLTRILGVELHGAVIPVRPRPGGPVKGRVLLVGDSAGLADPITGEGISHAIRSGQIAARALTGGEWTPDRVGRQYRDGLKREILAELRAGRPLARILYHCPRLRRAVFKRAGRRLSNAIAEVVLGRRSYRGLVRNPASYVKLLRGERAA
jgi:geranylgeranyl reductase family protein